MRKNLLAWQWSDYHKAHRSRLNLLIHIVAVPLFLLGNVIVVLGPLWTAWWSFLVGLALSAVAFGVQGVGHGREAQDPHPFDGPGDLITRMFAEQWVTFWRYLFTGGWWRAMRGA